MDLSEFVATGGGARSDAWLQLKADIHGAPLMRPAFTECGLMGTAILAGQATGAFSSLQEAADRLVAIEREFTPDPRRHEIYGERLAMYRELFPHMRSYLSRVSNIGCG